jgi:hypothetical protein
MLGVGVLMLLATGFWTTAAERRNQERAPDEVPAAVLQELRTRGCKLAGKKPKDIIQGEFYKQGQTDWVALCSAKDHTSLLVFPQGARERVAVLETYPKGFSKWSISTTDRGKLKSFRAAWGWKGPEPADIDHDGISSVVTFGAQGGCLYCYSEQEAIHYHHQDHWFTPVKIIAN